MEQQSLPLHIRVEQQARPQELVEEYRPIVVGQLGWPVEPMLAQEHKFVEQLAVIT